VKMPRPPAKLQQRFPVAVAVWGEHITLAPIDLAGVHIPAGTWTDFGSVPWLGRWLVPKMGRALGAYLGHDHLYQTQETTRQYADRLMLEVMRWYGVPWWRRLLAYAGVRAGGWVAWRRNAKIKANMGPEFGGWPVTKDEE